MIALPQRQELVAMISKARSDGARLDRACMEAGISMRTYERWVSHDSAEVRQDGRPGASRPTPANKLTEHERAQVLQTCMEPRFADLPPSQIVPILADEGRYLASESSMYRILHENQAQHHRGRARRRTSRKPPVHQASAPGQVWCWDITYLPSKVRGMYFYLYAVMDLYSRKLVAWEVHCQENGELAAQLFERARWRERLSGDPLILHSDNGAPQRSHTLRSKLQDLAIEPSYSRPGVSDDNAFIESWFRTLKYVPAYPGNGFEDLDKAREWTQRFVHWYNTEHRHRAIGYVTPAQRHDGHSQTVIEARKAVYSAARDANPARWTRNIRSWDHPDSVCLNKRHEGKKVA